MEKDKSNITCANCGAYWPDTNTSVCWKCGKQAKHFKVSIQGNMPSPTGRLKWKHVHTYYEKKKVSFLIVLCIALGSPFIGLLFAGFFGILIGLVFSIISLLCGINAITRVIKEVHGETQP